MSHYVITATGTDVGKTVFSAALVNAIGARYWKPVQAGLEGETDAQIVARLSRCAPDAILPEAYRFSLAASPHLSAAQERTEIDIARLDAQLAHARQSPQPLIVEGAGGVMVPVTRNTVFADLFARWQLPVILVCTTRLGTISHSLTAIEALQRRNVPIHGLVFVGDLHPDNEAIIPELSGVRRLGRLPGLYPLEPDALATAFARNFSRDDF